MFVGVAVMVVSLLIALPEPAGGQQVTLEVQVRDAESAEPLRGAQVEVEGGEPGLTDSRGRVRLCATAGESRAVAVTLLGFAPESATVHVATAGVTVLQVGLRRSPVAIEGVEVVAQAGVLAAHGFFERREGGNGTFFTRADIEKIRPRYLSDILRRAGGLTLLPTRTGARTISRGGRPGCGVQYYLNGTLAPFFDIDQILPGDVEGLEIYRGSATIPPAFNRGTALCGVILIWTRAG